MKIEKSICFDCKNGYANKCIWVKSLKPVKGWTAKAVDYAGAKPNDKTMFVIKCPNFKSCEELKAKVKCRMCGQEIKGTSAKLYCSGKCNSKGRYGLLTNKLTICKMCGMLTPIKSECIYCKNATGK